MLIWPCRDVSGAVARVEAEIRQQQTLHSNYNQELALAKAALSRAQTVGHLSLRKVHFAWQKASHCKKEVHTFAVNHQAAVLLHDTFCS